MNEPLPSEAQSQAPSQEREATPRHAGALSTIASASWSGSFSGEGQLNLGDASLDLSLPPAFGGTGKGVNPEELITAAIGSCFLITLSIIFTKRGVAVGRLGIEAELLTVPGRYPQITEVVLKPRVETDADTQLVHDALQDALEICVISRALVGTIRKRVEPQIVPLNG